MFRIHLPPGASLQTISSARRYQVHAASLSPLDGVGSGTPRSWRANAMLLARLALANKP